MYAEITQMYCNYLKFVLKLSLKIKILQCERNKMKDEAIITSNTNLLDHQKYFDLAISKINEQFRNAAFCKQTRLFSNLVFMLLKDLFKIYKVLECYNMEVLERFSSLTVEGGGEDLAKKAIELFQNFLKTTKDIEKKSVELIEEFEFPKQLLPVFYKPDEGLVDTLKVMIDCG